MSLVFIVLTFLNLFLAFLGHETGFGHYGLDDVDRHSEADRERDGIAGARVDLLIVRKSKAGEERAFPQFVDGCFRNRASERFDDLLEEIVRERGRAEADGLRVSVLPYVSGGMFFEIGAGFGGLLDGARRLGFAVAGIEPSEQAARFGRDVMGLEGLHHGVFDPCEWPADFCDVIYSFQVIEHVSDLHEFAGGIRKMLKPGGLAVVGTENHHNAWVMVRRVRSWLKGRRVPEFQTASHHTFYFSDRSLCRLLERHGLQIIRSLVYTAPLAEKRPQYHFRSWYSKLAFYALHYADVWTGRGNRLLVWCRVPQ